MYFAFSQEPYFSTLHFTKCTNDYTQGRFVLFNLLLHQLHFSLSL